MANDQQFRTQTLFLATRGVKEYRETIPELIQRHDVVLELGCEWGTTTTILAHYAQFVLGSDVSSKVIQEAKMRYPELNFAVLDAFDIRSLVDLNIAFTKIYIDLSGLSGYRSLLDVVALLNTYAAVLQPKAIVVKSGALKDFAKHCQAWAGLRG